MGFPAGLLMLAWLSGLMAASPHAGRWPGTAHVAAQALCLAAGALEAGCHESGAAAPRAPRIAAALAAAAFLIWRAAA